MSARVGAGDRSWETLTWEVDDDGVALLTLHRPDALNAFTVTMATELEQVFRAAASDDGVRAVVVTGAGKAFCAGMDLSAEGNVFGLDEEAAPTPEALREHFDEPPFADGVRDTGGKVVLAIHDCPKPVIAAVNGAAVGIGATMTLPMDLRLASTDARIGFVFGRLGIVPEACSTWFLPRIVGLPQALEWVYSADVLDAESARTGGLVRSVHEPEDLLPAALGLARSFVVDRSPVALGLARRMLYRNSAAPHPLHAHLADSLAMWHTSVGDGREGVAAFRERRSPRFTGRASELPRIYPDEPGPDEPGPDGPGPDEPGQSDDTGA